MVGWKHFCQGTQQWDEDTMQGFEASFSLPEARVKV